MKKLLSYLAICTFITSYASATDDESKVDVRSSATNSLYQALEIDRESPPHIRKDRPWYKNKKFLCLAAAATAGAAWVGAVTWMLSRDHTILVPDCDETAPFTMIPADVCARFVGEARGMTENFNVFAYLYRDWET